MELFDGPADGPAETCIWETPTRSPIFGLRELETKAQVQDQPLAVRQVAEELVVLGRGLNLREGRVLASTENFADALAVVLGAWAVERIGTVRGRSGDRSDDLLDARVAAVRHLRHRRGASGFDGQLLVTRLIRSASS